MIQIMLWILDSSLFMASYEGKVTHRRDNYWSLHFILPVSIMLHTLT